MEQAEKFSNELINYLEVRWEDGIERKMPQKINNELFKECKDFIQKNGGFPSSGMLKHKGWAFESALFYLLYTDQKIKILIDAHKIKPNDSRTLKLLGLEYFNLSCYNQAIGCLKKALQLGLDANPNATFELLGSCYDFINNTTEAKKWFIKSTRVDVNFIYTKYGSIKNYALLAFKRNVNLSENYDQNTIKHWN
jgi:tetratricopeptide (TPR) repeat protein